MAGKSATGAGVYAKSTNYVGLYAESESSYGVWAKSTSQIGFCGESRDHFGVYGVSTNARGLAGVSDGTTVNAIGVYGRANAPGYAGQFDGKLIVYGNFEVSGGVKNAVVPHPDGTQRRMYCMEAPESVFEDFGQAQLVGGRAEVRLDADFAQLVKADSYHVFLSPRGDSKGLYVSAQTPTGFEVREQQGGTSSVAFSYRVVARRKDVEAPRLDKVTLPKKLEDKDLPKAPPAPPSAPR